MNYSNRFFLVAAAYCFLARTGANAFTPAALSGSRGPGGGALHAKKKTARGVAGNGGRKASSKVNKAPPARQGGFGAATKLTVSIPIDPGWARLRLWLEARGANDLSGLEVGIVNPTIGLRGVVATRAFCKGDEIFVSPRDTCVLSESQADASPIRVVYGRAEVPAAVRVALLLLWLAATESEAWGPVLDVLPTRADFDAGGGGPLELWAPDDVAACRCPLLSAQVGARKLELRTLYDEILAPGWDAALGRGELRGVARPAFSAVQEAAVVVASRAFGEATEGCTSMLVPGVDMCNHDVRVRARARICLRESSAVLRRG
jgi:hypothetical protein